MRNIKAVADKLISPRHGVNELKFADGKTEDIISVMMWADKQKIVAQDTQNFAKHLRGKTDLQTAKNVYDFVKKQIQYKLDPFGVQWIKAPAATWSDGYADCKSRSIFQASLLKNLGIPAAYRFVSYEKSTPEKYTHVYVIIKAGNKWYASDPDMPEFNKEKPYANKLDKQMSKISFIAGIGCPPKGDSVGKLKLHKPADKMTEFDMELAIRKQRAEIQKQIAERLSGIGCPHAEKMQDKIDVINDMIEIQSDKSLNEKQRIAGIYGILELASAGEYDTHRIIAGIGDIGKKKAARKAKRQERKAKVKAKIKSVGKKVKAKVKKTLKKVANVAKKVGKALVKVATAPARLAAKGILEVSLPKSAPFFLYLFIKDPALIAKLPTKVAAKRRKSEKIAKFIIKGIGMKEDHFMGIIRNGIMKRYGKSPEELLRLNLQGKVSGIGDIGIITDIISVLLKVIKAVAKLFKGKKNKDIEEVSAADMPDPASDFGWSDAEPLEPDSPSANTSSRGFTPAESHDFGNQIKQQDQYDDDVSVPGEDTPNYVNPPGASTNSRSTKIC